MQVEIFFCYAREDEALRQGLEKQLKALKRQGIINLWHDRNISAGSDWEYEIEKHLNTAGIILLLVSPSFIDSDYCYGKEMARAMERHECGEAHVIPIILRPVYWQGAPFGKLQALPKDAKPVVNWRNREDAFFNVAEGIRQAVEELTLSLPIHSLVSNMNVIKPEQVKLTYSVKEEASQSESVTTPHLLPIYLLLDCSGSMAGDTISAINEGLAVLQRELSGSSISNEILISIISFSTHANLYQFVPINQFSPPILSGSRATSMGRAFRLLAESIEDDLSENSHYNPLVIVITDGTPTDDYRTPFMKVKSLKDSHKPNIIALGLGRYVDLSILTEVTQVVFHSNPIIPYDVTYFFRWISAIIIQIYHSLQKGNELVSIPTETGINSITFVVSDD